MADKAVLSLKYRHHNNEYILFGYWRAFCVDPTRLSMEPELEFRREAWPVDVGGSLSKGISNEKLTESSLFILSDTLLLIITY